MLNYSLHGRIIAVGVGVDLWRGSRCQLLAPLHERRQSGRQHLLLQNRSSWSQHLPPLHDQGSWCTVQCRHSADQSSGCSTSGATAILEKWVSTFGATAGSEQRVSLLEAPGVALWLPSIIDRCSRMLNYCSTAG